MGRYSNHPNSLVGRLQSLTQIPSSRSPDQEIRRPRQIQHRLTPGQQQELLERYLTGERAYVLAQAFEISRTTLDRLLKAQGLRRPRSMTEAEVTEATQMYDEGWSCQRIGVHLGRDHGTVWRALGLAGRKAQKTLGRST